MHVLVIGAYGSAGVAAAEGLVDRVGDDVDRLTLVDDGEPGGGLCILRGCMPSKEVLSASAHRFQARSDHRLTGDVPDLDLEAVVSTKDDHVSSFASHRRAAVHDLADRDGVTFHHGRAEFVADDRVRVETDEGPETMTPDYVVVATGSTVNVPDLPGIDEVDYWTSADVLDATSLPDSGVVMGFGYVGVEMVPYLAEAGVDLTVIEHDERPLDAAAAPIGDEVLSTYREEFGVDVLTWTREQRVAATDDGVELTVTTERDGPGDPREQTVEADELFLFTGRRPNVDGLGLDAAGIDTGDGWVEDTMQTRDHDRVFVVGDANGKEPVLHVAKEHGALAAENLLAHAAGDDLESYENVTHRVMFAGTGVYPYARVGHTADSAREADGVEDPVVVRREASDDGVFKTKDVPRGLAELVVDADGTVVGYHGLHYHADVMAKTMQVIVELGLDVREIPDRAYHPTTPEILDGLFRDAADEL